MPSFKIGAKMKRSGILRSPLLAFIVAAVIAASVVLAIPAYASNVPSLPATTGSISAKLWVVSPAQAGNVVFPAPSAAPDATFTTNGIAYIGQSFAPGTDPQAHCYTIEKFLNGCAIPAYHFAFSGVSNPNLGGAAAEPTTPMSGASYGIIIEFTGTITLTNGEQLSILHDDGVSLMIGGNLISGFQTTTAPAFMQSVTFTGTSGTYTFNLLYANSAGVGGGAWLVFTAGSGVV